MRAEPIDGRASVSMKPKFSRVPRKGPPVRLKVSEYPQKNHWKDAALLR